MRIALLVVASLVAMATSLQAEVKNVTLTGFVYEDCKARGYNNCDQTQDKKKVKLTLVSDMDYTVWFVTNPEVIRSLMDQHVKVEGELDTATLHLRISRVAPLPSRK